MALSFDGQATNTAVTQTSISATLTTTLTDNVIVAIVTLYTNNTAITNAVCQVSGISGGSLAWGRRSRKQVVSTTSSTPIFVETWWAHAPSALSAVSITATITNVGTACYQTITTFGVHGADLVNPFDPNSSLPAVSAIAGSGGSSSHTVTGISTTNADTLEFAILATTVGGSGVKAADTGFTLIANLYANASFGGAQTEYKINSSQLSSGSQNVFASFSAVTTNYLAIVDAIQAAPVSAWGGPKYVNTGGAVDVFATTMTPSLPGSRVNGNLLLAHSAVSTSSDTTTWPAGWTVIEHWVIGSQNGSKAYRYVDGTETAPAITWTGLAGAMARVDQFTNTHASAPIGSSSHNSANSTSVTATAITTTAANSLVVNYLDAGASVVPPLPAGFTVRNSGSFASPAAGGYQIAYESQPTSGGSHDSVSVTLLSSTNVQWLDFITEILAPAGSSQSIAVGLATETDTAFSISRTKVRSVGLATETDTSPSVRPQRSYALGLALENDTAEGLVRGVAVHLVTETDTAQSISPLRSRAIGLPSEVNTAFPILAVSPTKISRVRLGGILNNGSSLDGTFTSNVNLDGTLVRDVT